MQIVNEELVAILGGQQRKLQFAKTAPTVIMLAGLQGSGKTTLAGKLSKWLKAQGQKPLLVAADLQRPNAVNQLQVVGERAGDVECRPDRAWRRRLADRELSAMRAGRRVVPAIDQRRDARIADVG